MQIATWLHLLMDQNVVHPDAVENLSEFARTFLERCGNRSSLGVVIIWLATCRMSLILFNGTRLEDVRMALSDLYVRSTKLRNLAAYWNVGCSPPIEQIVRAIQFLQALRDRHTENRSIRLVLNEMLLLSIDVRNQLLTRSQPREVFETDSW